MANLGAVLADVDLSDANLRGAKLSYATLRGANLSGADLCWADLRNVQGVTCEQLKMTKHWEFSFRNDDLACGAAIPDPTKDGPKPSARSVEADGTGI